MSEIDPREKAAECARASAATVDPEHQAMLGHLQNLWTALGAEQDTMSVDDVAREVEAIGQLHVALLNARQRIFH